MDRFGIIIVLFIIIISISSINAARRINDTCGYDRACSDGLILPVWRPVTGISTLMRAFRAFVYFVAMAYLFLGVSIVADRFMAAIEVITSQEREVRLRKITGEPYTILIRVWNETVSNLTLMALGSSAPEILLSVIEIFGNKFQAGDLGPGTIVGSAAYNLFVIIAICVFVIPTPEVRRVKHINVFWVTVIWSTFAYIWLYLILAVISPGVVQVWEGVLTFAFFPLTVITSYIADRYTGTFGSRFLRLNETSFAPRLRPPSSTKRNGSGEDGAGADMAMLGDGKNHHMLEDVDSETGRPKTTTTAALNDPDAAAFEEHRNQYLRIFRKLRSEHPDAPIDEVERLAAEKMLEKGKKSRAFYRIQATRKLVGAGDIISKSKAVLKSRDRRSSRDSGVTGASVLKTYHGAIVSFDPAHYCCMENIGTIYVTVTCDRSGLSVDQEPCTVLVDYRTVPDTAHEHSDFVPTTGVLQFENHEVTKQIAIEIVDNDIYEEDEQFLVKLSNCRAFRTENNDQTVPARLATPMVATVMIVDDDHAGAFGFESEKVKVQESDGRIDLAVVRTRGARGEVSIPFKTVDGLAKNGKDYIANEGFVHFVDEQTRGEISITIINDDEYEKAEEFYVQLGDPIWKRDDQSGEAEAGRPVLTSIARCKVVITENKEFRNFVDRMLAEANSSILVGSTSWKEQFHEAITIEPSTVGATASVRDNVMHWLSVPWKVLFALIPPTDYVRGWLCFVVSIFCIGMLTAFIGDLASHFGCTIGLKDSVTAISLVALGTSIPDTFASKMAAIQDDTADSSIGNVTGSNAVNVFLGIGIAWSIAAIYHAFNGTSFYVHAGSLAFSVTMFLIGSALCIVIIQIRRYYGTIGGELGGPFRYKIATAVFFVTIWLLYILLSSLEAYCIIDGF